MLTYSNIKQCPAAVLALGLKYNLSMHIGCPMAELILTLCQECITYCINWTQCIFLFTNALLLRLDNVSIYTEKLKRCVEILIDYQTANCFTGHTMCRINHTTSIW